MVTKSVLADKKQAARLPSGSSSNKQNSVSTPSMFAKLTDQMSVLAPRRSAALPQNQFMNAFKGLKSQMSAQPVQKRQLSSLPLGHMNKQNTQDEPPMNQLSLSARNNEVSPYP